MQYISGALSPWGGTLADPLGGNLLEIFVSAVDADINLLNTLIAGIIPWAPMIPNLEQLIGALGSAFGQNGILCGLMQGVPLIELLFGSVGSGLGLFGQSALFALGGLFAGLESTPLIQQLIQAAGGIGSTLQDFGNLFAGLVDSSQVNQLISDATILGSQITGDLSVLLTVGGRELGPVLSQLNSTGGYIGALGLAQITGFGSGIESWLTSGGALPTGTTLAHTAITDWNAATATAISTASIALSQITGFGSGIESWLTSGGALPSATTLAHTAITDWNAATATAISTASIALGQITGFGSGIESWLTSGGALPSSVSIQGTQLTGSVSGNLISGATTIEQGIVDGIGQASQGAQSFVQQAVTDYNSAVATVQNLVSPITSIVSVIPNLW